MAIHILTEIKKTVQKMNCIAIDDEPKALEVIDRYCKKINFITLSAVFREPIKAIEFLTDKEVDIIFLDINMPDVNGLQLLKSLPKLPMVIFTTAYSEYAVESYDVSAIDYLLKPITFERFLLSVNKAFELFALKNKATFDSEFIFIKSGAQTHRLESGRYSIPGKERKLSFYCYEREKNSYP